MDSRPANNNTTGRERKAPKRISKTYLENAALYYLQRYATSAANLRRVLMRKVKRSCTFHQTEAEDFAPLVDELVARYTNVGLVDDKVFAHAKVSSLRRQGHSGRSIIARLQVKGLTTAQIEAAMKNVDDGNEEAEISAAHAYAKRKKLGPWRRKAITDPKDLQKEMAAMGRAGFSYEMARRALTFNGEEE
jgi:regulatory protein